MCKRMVEASLTSVGRSMAALFGAVIYEARHGADKRFIRFIGQLRNHGLDAGGALTNARQRQASPFREAAVGMAPDRVAPTVTVPVRFAHRLLVDLHAEAGALGNREVPVDRRQRLRIGA